jgi:hypothetical protein
MLKEPKQSYCHPERFNEVSCGRTRKMGVACGRRCKLQLLQFVLRINAMSAQCIKHVPGIQTAEFAGSLARVFVSLLRSMHHGPRRGVAKGKVLFMFPGRGTRSAQLLEVRATNHKPRYGFVFRFIASNSLQ